MKWPWRGAIGEAQEEARQAHQESALAAAEVERTRRQREAAEDQKRRSGEVAQVLRNHLDRNGFTEMLAVALGRR